MNLDFKRYTARNTTPALLGHIVAWAKSPSYRPKSARRSPSFTNRFSGPRSERSVYPEGSRRVKHPRQFIATVPEEVRLKRLLQRR
jgi:hypothetical protein